MTKHLVLKSHFVRFRILDFQKPKGVCHSVVNNKQPWKLFPFDIFKYSGLGEQQMRSTLFQSRTLCGLEFWIFKNLMQCITVLLTINNLEISSLLIFLNIQD